MDSYTEMTMRQQFNIAGQLFSVAIDGDAVVGYALVVPTFREHEAYFMSLVACDDLGFSAISLTVDAGNDIAMKLYSTFSFIQVDEVRGYFGEDKDRLVLVRTT